MAKSLTKKQKEILSFIKNYCIENSFPPSINEISTYFKISIKASYDHIKALEKKGFIKCDLKKKRSLRIIKEEENNLSGLKNFDEIDSDRIPILGIVQAGKPILSYEHSDSFLQINRRYFGDFPLFALLIRGDSMIDAGIYDGDIAIIKEQHDFENGDVIVVETENGVTIKKGYKEANRLRLVACNDNYEDIYTSSPRVIGKLVGLVRKY